MFIQIESGSLKRRKALSNVELSYMFTIILQLSIGHRALIRVSLNFILIKLIKSQIFSKTSI